MLLIEPPVKLNDVDRRIWAEELDPFVPHRVFDVHTHVYRWAFNTDPGKENSPAAALVKRGFGESDSAILDALDSVLMPGRRMSRLLFGWPFWPSCDFEGGNRFVAEQARQRPGSGGLMLVRPSMSPDYLEEQIAVQGFLGFKPYRFYAHSGDVVECRITGLLARGADRRCEPAWADRHAPPGQARRDCRPGQR